MTEHTLIELKNKIEKAKTKTAELKGRKKLLEEQMKKQWGCDSIQDLRRLLQEKKEQQVKIEEKIDTLSKEIEEKYNV